MFRLPLTQIPDIQPHTQAHILAGPSLNEPTCYFVSVTPAGVFFNTPLGRGGHLDRFDCMRMLLDQLHLASTGRLVSIDPIMHWFYVGQEYRGDDRSVFSIFRAFVTAFRDWHRIREDAYANLLSDIEYSMGSTSQTLIDNDMMQSWDEQHKIVDNMVDRDGGFSDALSKLLSSDNMYGGSTSMIAQYRSLADEPSMLLTSYQ
jgi:hypothetical protein